MDRKNKLKNIDVPKTLWAVGINLVGMWGPYKVTLNEDSLDIDCIPIWYDRSGNFDVSGTGLIESDGCFTYADPDKGKVELFLLGATIVAKKLENFLCSFTRK